MINNTSTNEAHYYYVLTTWLKLTVGRVEPSGSSIQ
jgi:hypothetical protein